MPNNNTLFDEYRQWLGTLRSSARSSDVSFVQDSFESDLMSSPAYHGDAKCNGVTQAIVATRVEMCKCKIAVVPQTTVNVGDLIEVFNEHWICVELYQDEYGLTYGELWLCNIEFAYQDFNLKVIHKYAVLDNGSYSKNNDSAIPVENNYYNCYISFDEESECLFVDKRLALDTMYDQNHNRILDVGKISWVDKTSKNFGSGSHLMVFGLKDDVYNAECDNITLKICDYKESRAVSQTNNVAYLAITGRETIKIGTSRTYSVTAVNAEGNSVAVPTSVVWQVSNAPAGVTFTANGTECVITIKLSSDLIGQTLHISCVDSTGVYAAAEKEVAVVQIG